MPTSKINGARRRAKRQVEPRADMPQAPKKEEAGAQGILNSIRPTKPLAKDPTATRASGKRPKVEPSTDERPRDRAREIPDDVRKRFTQVGNEFYFPDGTRAFTDRGGRITSPSENSEVIRSLIAIAEARGWSDVTIKGSERFRREAWYAARQAGIEVRGYRASAYDEARLARTLSRGSESRVSEERVRTAETDTDPDRRSGGARADSRGRTASDGRGKVLHVGRLADHGAAPYRHDTKNGMSYFVRLETPDGEREIWGVDLHRALKESLTRPQIGDDVGLRAVRRDAVTLQAARRDEEGNITRSERLTAHRNRWILEHRGFFEDRAQAARIVRDPRVDPKSAVKGHPELAGTYLKIRASELAAKAIRDPEDRNRFVATVRRALAEEIARGEPLTPVRLKEASRREKDARTQESDRAPVR